MGRIGAGNLGAHYDRVFGLGTTNPPETNSFGNIVTNTNPRDDMVRDMKHIHKIAEDHNTFHHKAFYSMLYYASLVIANFLLFVISLAFGRTVLKEIAASGRLITTASLVFANAIFLLVAGGVFLLILTILAIPLFWVAIPALYYLANDSIQSFVLFMLSGTITLFFAVGKSALTVLAVAMLPSLTALLIGFIAYCLVRFQTFTYKCISGFMENLSTKNIYLMFAVLVALAVMFIDFFVRVLQFFFGFA
jgi:hypothetical protein